MYSSRCGNLRPTPNCRRRLLSGAEWQSITLSLDVDVHLKADTALWESMKLGSVNGDTEIFWILAFVHCLVCITFTC